MIECRQTITLSIRSFMCFLTIIALFALKLFEMRYCKLITCDIFGTILQPGAPVGIQYAKAASRFGLHLNPDLLGKNFKTVWYEMNAEYPIYGFQGMGWENWWKKLVNRTFNKSYDSELDKDTMNTISSFLVQMYERPSTWKYCDGALEFMDHVRRRNISLGVLSNFDARLEELLVAMNIRHYFAFVVASYNVGVQKPDKRIFEICEEIMKDNKKLANIKRSEILHVGDTPDLDFIAATNAGWRSVLIHKDAASVIKAYPTIRKEFIFKDLNEIRNVIA